MTKSRSEREKALSLLAGKAAFGRAFFDVASEALVLGLGYRWGGIAQMADDRQSLTMLSWRERDRAQTPRTYALSGSPCETVYAATGAEPHIFIPYGVAERFPDLADLHQIGAVCYRGEVFFGSDGMPAGHVFAIDDREHKDDPASRAFFRLVSQRVGAEYNRWRAEEALRDSEARTRAAEQRLRDAVEGLSDGFALYDAEDRLVLFNRKWAEIYGYAEADLKSGVTYEDLVRLDARNQVVASDRDLYVRQRMGYRRQFSGSFDFQLKDGRWITIRESPTSEGGIVGVQTEITDRMEAIETLLGEKAAAEQANNSKTEFVARISHELRTPLNAISGFAEIIRSATFGPVGNPRYQEYAGDIIASADHVLELVNNLLDLAKVEAGMEELREDVLDVGETVRAALVFVREAAAKKGIGTELYISADLPKLRADPGKLKQILINLIANSIKFSAPGDSVMVMVRGSPEDGLVFEVADTGPGIAPENLEKALAEYGRVASPNAPLAEGTGLGLPLASAMAALHGGTLELDSVPGIGTLVTVTLPWERAVQPRDKGRVTAF